MLKARKNEGKNPNVQEYDDEDDTMNKTKQTLFVSTSFVKSKKRTL